MVCAGIILFCGIVFVEWEHRFLQPAARSQEDNARPIWLLSKKELAHLSHEAASKRDVLQIEAVTPSLVATKDQLRELMGIALTTPTPEAVLEFSAFASRLRRLGPYNIMMVFTQRPGARAVASRKKWAEAGQTVRPDAIPILILQPKGPTVQVFELQDTLPQREKDPRQDAFAAVGEFMPGSGLLRC